MAQHTYVTTESISLTRPPRVRSTPLVGNLFDFFQGPSAFFVRCYQEYGPAFRIKMGPRVQTVLAGPQANLFMAREGKDFIRSYEFWQGLNNAFDSKKGLVSTDGAIHTRLRKVMKRGFSRSSVSARYDELIGITDEWLDTYWQTDATVAVVPAMQRLAAEQLGIMVIGQRPGEYVDDLRDFIRYILNVTVTKQWPRVALQLPQYKRAKARTFALGQQMIDTYDPDTFDPENPTFVDDIMRAHLEDPTLFVDGELMMAVLGPYFAGLDTVANTTSAMLYSILKHPALYEQIVEEVDAAFAAHDGTLTPQALRDMPLLHAAALESLRMYPINVAGMRNATRDFEFEGYRIVENEPLYMASTVTHFLPEFFADPHKFDVTRYAKPRLEHRKPGAWAPFGLGPHTCLGAGLAEVQIALSLATMLHRVRFALDPIDYELKLKVTPTPGPELKFMVRVLGRRH